MIIKDRKISSYILDCLILVLGIFVPYQQVSSHRFIEFDDGIYAFYNSYIIRGLSWNSIVWSFTNTESANWHPLTWLSHLVDRELFGPHPGGYLLENVAWHALAACLLYHLFRKCTNDRLVAFCIAIVFALHPVNVENVAWTSERKSLLNAVFWFGGAASFLTYLEKRDFKSYGITVILFILSLYSKPMSVTFPCTLFLIYCWREIYQGRGRENFRWIWHRDAARLAVALIPMFAISAYFSWVTTFAQSVAMSSVDAYPIGARLVNVIISYWEYVKMFFHPTALAPFYPLFISTMAWPLAIVPGACLLLITLGALLAVKRRPELTLGWLWYLGTMVPVIGLVQVGAQSHADRYLYVPMIGLAFLFPTLIRLLPPLPKFTPAATTAGLAAIIVSLGTATFIQVAYWKNGSTLFRHSIDVTGDCLTSVCNIATSYARNGEFDKSALFLDLKIKVAKNPANIARFNAMKAACLINLKKYDEAIVCAKYAFEHGHEDSSTAFCIAFASNANHDHVQAKKYMDIAEKLQKPVQDVDYMDRVAREMQKRLALELHDYSSATQALPN